MANGIEVAEGPGLQVSIVIPVVDEAGNRVDMETKPIDVPAGQTELTPKQTVALFQAATLPPGYSLLPPEQGGFDVKAVLALAKPNYMAIAGIGGVILLLGGVILGTNPKKKKG